MLIGFNVLDTDSVFAKGSNRTALSFAFWCCENGHTVSFLSPTGNPNQFVEIKELLAEKKITLMSIDAFLSTSKQFDILFEISFYTPDIIRQKISKKCIMWFHTQPLFNDMEGVVYFYSNFIRKMKNIAEVWIPECYSDDNRIYIERIYNLPVRFVPWIWEHETLDLYCKKNSLQKWNQNNNKTIHCCVLESNNTNTSNCIIPLCIIAEINDAAKVDWIVSNGETLKKNAYFKNNILSNLFPKTDVSGNFVGRIPIPELRKFKSVLITHQRWKSMKHLLLDALWLDIPMIHNSEIVEKGLKKSGGYYYFFNEIDSAKVRYDELINDLITNSNFFSTESQSLRKLFCLTAYDYKSDKHMNFFRQALSNNLPLLKQISTGKTLRITFSDMWAEFNPNYNFFTLLVEDYIKRENLGIELIIDPLSPQLVIFGPFGDNFRKYSNTPKLFFSGENSPHIGGPDLIMSVGHHPELNEKTLRIPLWILEVDWFGADPNKIQNPKPIPYETCCKPSLSFIAKKDKFCSYIVSNPKNEYRNVALPEISKYKNVDSAGAYQNNMGHKLEGGLGGGGGELIKHTFLQSYKFSITFENEQNPGYITEKYFHAKAAGCIPIYWGDPDLSRDFDPAGGINTHGKSWDQIRSEIKSVDEDVAKWLQMFAVPALPPKSEEYARKQMNRLAKTIVDIVNVSLSPPPPVQTQPPPPVQAQPLPPVQAQPLPPVQAQVEKKTTLENNFKFISAVNNLYFTGIYIWADGLLQNGIKEENLKVYYWSDLTTDKIQDLLKTYPKMQVEPFPESDEKLTFWPDYWNTAHFAWKLWIINNEIEKGNSGMYLDIGILVMTPIQDIIKSVEDDGVFLLEIDNPLCTNNNFCHKVFKQLMTCSTQELDSRQISAGFSAWNINNQKVVNYYKIAYLYTKIKEIIVGDKWIDHMVEGYYGHRHDQSILSVLSFRNNFPRKQFQQYVAHDYNEAVDLKVPFYLHRGKVLVDNSPRPKMIIPKKEFTQSINEAYVINLDRREDRYKSFKEFHHYMANRVKRHPACNGLTLQLTPEIKHLFRNNDFKWKKAVVGCAISHNTLWKQLSSYSDLAYSYLILEDDVRFHPQWIDIWKQASTMIPDDADVIYLGGILPPNKDVFATVIESVNQFFVRIKENDLFQPGQKRRYFHSCNYSYILFARGAKKLQKIIEEKGIFTSGDHMIVNHMEELNIYFMRPIVAGCFQDLDPRYQKSEFNNFDRKDNFDSDLWNNNEHFDPNVEENIKESGVHDLIMDDSNIQANTILLMLAQGKLQEFLNLSQSFLENIYNKCESNESNNNWFRVILQILTSQSVKYSTIQKEELKNCLTTLKNKSTNQIIQACLEELLNKISNDIIGGAPGISSIPNASFIKNGIPLWYFIPNHNNTCLEKEWLEEIISRPIEFIAYGNEYIGNHAIHFLMIQKWERTKDIILEKLNSLHSENKKAVLVHISDEFLNDNLEIYEHPAVELILRNYVREIKTTKKIITIPLGYVNNRSLKGHFKKMNERKYVWSFAGSIDKSGRVEMLQNLSRIEPNSMKLLKTWKAPTAEEAKEYMDTLNDTVFIPCPKGVNYETYRIYEALESGCIPICITSDTNEHQVYETLIGSGVILMVKDWPAALNTINQIYSNKSVLDQLQDNLTKYWMNQKLRITSNILTKLNDIENMCIAKVNEQDVKTIHL